MKIEADGTQAAGESLWPSSFLLPTLRGEERLAPRTPRILLPRDAALDEALARVEAILGPTYDGARRVPNLAIRGAEGLIEDAASRTQLAALPRVRECSSIRTLARVDEEAWGHEPSREWRLRH